MVSPFIPFIPSCLYSKHVEAGNGHFSTVGDYHSAKPCAPHSLFRKYLHNLPTETRNKSINGGRGGARASSFLAGWKEGQGRSPERGLQMSTWGVVRKNKGQLLPTTPPARGPGLEWGLVSNWGHWHPYCMPSSVRDECPLGGREEARRCQRILQNAAENPSPLFTHSLIWISAFCEGRKLGHGTCLHFSDAELNNSKVRSFCLEKMEGLLHSKRNNQQNKKATYRVWENSYKPTIW